jgi:CheY-like chemotaxis protein
MLAGDEHTVISATSAEVALATLQHARFDLIIVDYQLPGMKGDELAAAVRSRDPQLPVVMITAYPETLALSRKQLAGVDLVISKPFGLQELREAVSKLLGDNRREG